MVFPLYFRKANHQSQLWLSLVAPFVGYLGWFKYHKVATNASRTYISHMYKDVYYIYIYALIFIFVLNCWGDHPLPFIFAQLCSRWAPTWISALASGFCGMLVGVTNCKNREIELNNHYVFLRNIPIYLNQLVGSISHFLHYVCV